ncbi:MAG: diacylglycerol O-acyltransferase / wax synthase [Mycobacterium sp.]|nr:diacylglycerol O-acyltransferase / wax synthase [Mycobacterium sp.]
MADTLDAAGLPERLNALDLLLHRGEANPRTRSGIMALEVLDGTPPWDRFVDVFEQASRHVLRLRQKVVVPTVPTASPRWVVDPDFNINYHVRRVRVPEPGTLREVFDLAEVSVQSPMDISRPLWTATLVEGLEGGRAATLLHMSHAVTDGVGAVEMFAHIYDLERDPPPRKPAPLPIPQDLTANELARVGLNRLPNNIIRGSRGALAGAAKAVGKVLSDPASAVGGVVEYARSGSRVMSTAATHSPLLRRRSLSSRTEAIEMELGDIRAAAKAAEGSINDAYLAALCGALRHYHDELGMPVEALPMAVPVNLRAEADPAGGNRFAGVMISAPLGIADPATRIRSVRTQMIKGRDEAAIDVIGAVAPLLGLLPDPILESVAGSVVSADVQASNVPVYAGDTFLAGSKVLRQFGLGPLPGVAMMAVLISRGGMCTVTTRYDRASVTDEDVWARCLLTGFDEVLALGGAGRAAPASFTLPASTEQEPASSNGSSPS